MSNKGVSNTFRIENITPVLSVKDVQASRDFYVGTLKFQECDWGDDIFTSFSKEGGSIYVCKGAQGNPGTWIWVGFDGDIFDLHQQLLDNGVKIRMAPRNFSWALEMHIEDPDGHVLRFGCEPDTSKSFLDELSFKT